MHHKQQLLDLQQAKKNFLTSQAEKAAAASAATSGGTTGGSSVGSLQSKGAEHIMKTQEWMFKKQFKQYSSKVWPTFHLWSPEVHVKVCEASIPHIWVFLSNKSIMLLCSTSRTSSTSGARMVSC